jgi:hypothetical protein
MRKNWYLELYKKDEKTPHTARDVADFADIRAAFMGLDEGGFIRVGVPDRASDAELKELQTLRIERL